MFLKIHGVKTLVKDGENVLVEATFDWGQCLKQKLKAIFSSVIYVFTSPFIPLWSIKSRSQMFLVVPKLLQVLC